MAGIIPLIIGRSTICYDSSLVPTPAAPPIICYLELGEVAVVVAHHLEVKHLGFLVGGVLNEGVFDDTQDIAADVFELFFDFPLDLTVVQ